jgi:hypothetical protein
MSPILGQVSLIYCGQRTYNLNWDFRRLFSIPDVSVKTTTDFTFSQKLSGKYSAGIISDPNILID